MRIHTDLSRIPISVAPSPATSGTSLGVTDANAAYLPDTYPYWAVAVPTGSAPTRSNSEILKVTAGSSAAGTTTLTIVRAQGIPVTTAQSITTSFDIYDANSAEALPQVSSDVTETPSGTLNGSNTSFTLSTTPTSGTLSLYLNGVRQTLTSDYTISGTTITMVTAPVSTDSLTAMYKVVSGTFSVGSVSFIDNEVVSGTVNGSNTSFTIAFTPVSGTLHLVRDGQEIYSTGDYSLSGTTITMVTAPTTGTVLYASYQKSLSTAGNADLLDGYHANVTPTAGQIPVLDSSALLPIAAVPTGVLGYAETTTNQGSITTETDLTSLTTTVTVPSGGRRVRIVGQCMAYSSAAGDNIELRIKESTTSLMTVNQTQVAANTQFEISCQRILTPTAGSHTYKLTLKRATGSGTLSTYHSDITPSFISVEQL